MTIGTALFFWLLWTSVGSGVITRGSIHASDAARKYIRLFPWFGFLGYAGVCAIGAVPALANLTPGEQVPYDLQFIATAAVFLPFNIIGGRLFALGVISTARKDTLSAGRIYSVESLGSAAGGIAVSLVLVALLPNNIVALLCPVLALLTVLVSPAGRRGAFNTVNTIIPLLLTAMVFLWYGHASTHYYRGQILLAQRDTRYGRLRVTRHGEQVTFYSGASTLFSHPDPESSEHAAHYTPSRNGGTITDSCPRRRAREVLSTKS